MGANLTMPCAGCGKPLVIRDPDYAHDIAVMICPECIMAMAEPNDPRPLVKKEEPDAGP